MVNGDNSRAYRTKGLFFPATDSLDLNASRI